jgi:hypothetical protein
MSLLPKRPLYRWLLILGVIVGSVLVSLCTWAMYARYSFGARIAAIRAAGDPASITDLAPQPIPEENDAAAQLAAVTSRVNDFANEHGQFYKTPTGLAYEEANDLGEPATVKQLATIRAIVEKYPDLDAAVARAAACGGYASRLDYSLPQPQLLASMAGAPVIDIRAISRFVGWQMELANANGRQEDAVEKGIQLLHLARLYETEPSLLSSMLANAVRITAVDAIYDALAAGPLASDLHAQLDEELAKHGDINSLKHMLKTERAFSISALETLFGGINPLIMNTIGWPIRKHQVSILDLYEILLPVIATPWYQVQNDPKLQKLWQTPTGMGLMADQMLPAIEAAYGSANRALAVTRSLRVYNALRQFSAQHGREADGLADLPLPKGATIDPFSGQPLKLKRIDDGWLIYSVGKDAVDGGGSFDDSKDYGLWPRKPAKKSSAFN